MSNLNSSWLTENPLLKNKNQKYYYDFGTGIKIERDEVKQEREALLNSTSKTSGKNSANKPINQKKDAFLEGFDDPYGEKREQERQQKEQERKERFANIRANADKRNQTSQSETDPFLDGFNGVSNQQRVKFPNTQLQSKPLAFPNTQMQTAPTVKFPNTQLQASPYKKNDTQFSKTDPFVEGFNDPYGEKWEEKGSISNSYTPQPNVLSIAPMGREGRMWCWIAAASMVDEYYHPEDFASQEEIAEQLGKGRKDGGYIEETSELGEGSRSCTTSGFSDRISPEKLTYEKIQEEMQNRHPIVLLTETGGGYESEHYVVIVGCYINGKGERYVVVNETREEKNKDRNKWCSKTHTIRKT